MRTTKISSRFTCPGSRLCGIRSPPLLRLRFREPASPGKSTARIPTPPDGQLSRTSVPNRSNCTPNSSSLSCEVELSTPPVFLSAATQAPSPLSQFQQFSKTTPNLSSQLRRTRGTSQTSPTWRPICQFSQPLRTRLILRRRARKSMEKLWLCRLQLSFKLVRSVARPYSTCPVSEPCSAL